MLRSGNTELRKVEAMADLRESFATLEDSGTSAGKSLAARIEGDAAASQNGSIGFSFKDSSGNVILPSLTAGGLIQTTIAFPYNEGDASAGVDGLVGFVYKDSSGNLVLPSLDSAGNIKVVVDHASAQGSTSAVDGSIGFSYKDSSGNLVLPSLDTAGNIKVTFADRTCLKSPAGELAAGSATLVAVTGASITLAASTVYDNIGFIFSCRRDSLFQLIQTDDVTLTVLAEFIVGAGQYTVVGELHCFKVTSGATGVQTLSVKAKNFEAQSSLRATITAQVS